MAKLRRIVRRITFVDLYAGISRKGNIDIDKRASKRLLDHNVILFQFPLFWYSNRPLIKELLGFVLEHGFCLCKGGWTSWTANAIVLPSRQAGPERLIPNRLISNFRFLRTLPDGLWSKQQGSANANLRHPTCCLLHCRAPKEGLV